MFVATAILSGLLALLFTAASLGKLGREQRQVDTAEKLMIPWARYRLIAAPEAGGAIGLLVGLKVAPLGVAAAAGLVALMAGAVLFRGRDHDAKPLIAGDAMVMVIARGHGRTTRRDCVRFANRRPEGRTGPVSLDPAARVLPFQDGALSRRYSHGISPG
jgi:hypothetical protein